MNLSVDNTFFYAQHKNKCYCQNRNLCYCTGIENPSRNSKRLSHKFIKACSDKQKQNQSITSLCSTNFFSPAPNSISASSIIPTSCVSSSEPKLTGRRELYERSKLVGVGFNHKNDIRTWKERVLVTGAEHSDLFSYEQIAKLQEFRLQNPNECLSSCNRFSMDKMKQLGKSKEIIVAETKYTLNNRGLLKTIGGSVNSGAAIVPSKSAVKDILRQKLNSSKNKDKIVRKALCLPDNSLALRYQKTY